MKTKENPKNMRIRFAEEKDIPDMLRLLEMVCEVHHHIRPDLFRKGGKKYDEAMLRWLLQDETRPVFCCDLDGKMVGYAFCILQSTENDPVLLNQRTLYIDDLCVEETLRGTGCAKALFDAVVEFGKEKGCDEITLNVWTGNDRALGFYEKCGFKPRKVYMEYSLRT